jgi:hypothetical protein
MKHDNHVDDKSNIYVLLCKEHKYYIGRDVTGDIPSKWVRLFPPITILQTTIGDDNRLHEILFSYMERYGIDNVRGGRFCDPLLHSDDRSYIDQQLKKYGINDSAIPTQNRVERYTIKVKPIKTKCWGITRLINFIVDAIDPALYH